jgi:hypothetical protein
MYIGPSFPYCKIRLKNCKKMKNLQMLVPVFQEYLLPEFPASDKRSRQPLEYDDASGRGFIPSSLREMISVHTDKLKGALDMFLAKDHFPHLAAGVFHQFYNRRH